MSDSLFSQVKLLLHCNGANAGTVFVDDSSLSAAVTPTSCTTSTTQKKYGATSASFNGTTSKLEIPYSASYDLGSSDWTIELWIYPTTTPAASEEIITHREDAVTPANPLWFLRRLVTTGNLLFEATDASGSNITSISSSSAPTLNTWNHIAITRASGSAKIWLNGVDVTSVTTNLTTAYPAITSGHRLFMGATATGASPYTGYLDDIRLTIGTARYTAAFTIPSKQFSDNASADDPYYNSTILLLRDNGANSGTIFIDDSPLHSIVTPTTCTTSTAQFKYGNASAFFNNTGTTKLQTPHSSSYNFGAQDWTIELWVRPSVVNVTQYLIALRTDSTHPHWSLALVSTGEALFFRTNGAGTTLDDVRTTGFPLTANTWAHIAVTRASGVTKIWLDGVDRTTIVASSTLDFVDTTTQGFRIGSLTGDTFPYSGYLDDIRITKGIARYTSTFTPPTEEFSTTPGVSELISESLATVTTGSESSLNGNNILSELLLLLGEAENQFKEGSVSESYISVATLISTLNTSEVISEALTLVLSELITQLGNINESVNEPLDFTTSTLTDSITRIFDSISIISNSIGNINTSNTILETLLLLDGLLIQFNSLVSEGLVASDTTVFIVEKMADILEQLAIGATFEAKVIFFNTLLETINYLTSILHGYQFTVSESLSIASTITDLWKFHNTISDSLLLSLTSSENTLGLLSISDNLSFSSTISSSAILKELLSSNLIIKIPSLSGSEEYLAYTFSPETSSVTNYDNYSFTSSTKFNEKYLLANSDGLYEYGGTTDAGTTIKSYIETAALSFGTSNLKQVPSLYLGVSSDDSVILIVRLDGKGEITYKLNKFTQDLQTQKVDIGKGLIGRYFQFELITESDIFNLDSIELYPVELKRKL